jgi:hypothetical protein
MPSIRMLAISIGCSTLLYAGACPSAPASAQVLERGVEGAAVGAIIGGIVGGGKGAATGAAIGGGVGVLSGAAEANARAQGYYGPPPGYGPPPPDYYGPPPRGYYRPPHVGYYGPPRAAIAVSISTAPPPLPVYEQPFCPGPGYIWTPGYWAYAGGYYWVPGTWVLPPAVGLVWTPGYWGYDGRRYLWHAGYWGPQVGYYGGINYGFGYSGDGYEGGYWEDGVFFYNTAVTKVNTTVIAHTYNKTVVNTVATTNVSFNGPGGSTAQPTAQELARSQGRHTPPTSLQVKHQRTARTNRNLFAAVNHGTPPLAATAKPGVFKGPETVGPKDVVATTNPTRPASQSSLDEAKYRPDQKPLPHGPDKTAPFANVGHGPDSGKDASGRSHGPNGETAPIVRQTDGAIVANGETGPHAGKRPQAPGGARASGQTGAAKHHSDKPDVPSAVATGDTGRDTGKHAVGVLPGAGEPVAKAEARPNGGPHAPQGAHAPGSRDQGASPKGTPVAQDGSHSKKNKHDKGDSPETTQGM